MDMKIKRGQILKDLRKAKGLNQNELAAILEVSNQAYQKYEYGTAEPTFDNLCKLADFYSVTTDYLLGRKELTPLEKLMQQANNMTVFEVFSELPTEAQEAINIIITAMANKSKED